MPQTVIRACVVEGRLERRNIQISKQQERRVGIGIIFDVFDSLTNYDYSYAYHISKVFIIPPDLKYM